MKTPQHVVIPFGQTDVSVFFELLSIFPSSSLPLPSLDFVAEENKKKHNKLWLLRMTHRINKDKFCGNCIRLNDEIALNIFMLQ